MNKNSAAYLMDILSLLFFTALTIVAVVMQEITIFYVIYIFWWDECIKTVFDFLHYLFNKKEIEHPLVFKASIGSRFFMLFIYIVFIIVCFGFIIEWGTDNSIYKNTQILLFQNIYFNISLVSFIGREIYVYRNKRIIIKIGGVSKGIGILHISIILGILMWAITTNRLGFRSSSASLEKYGTFLAIIPFLIIKFFFDWVDIKWKRRS